MPEAAARLFGLVLSGGKSVRMGQDKGSLIYTELGRTEDQRQVTARLLEKNCEQVFISCRKEQLSLVPAGFEAILDSENAVDSEAGEVQGPAAGLIAAHHRFPDVAWLVLACDFPLATEDAVSQLTRERNPDLYATTYVHKTGHIEPFFTIWEPKALRDFKTSSPSRFLESVPIHKLSTDTDILKNCNSTFEKIGLQFNKRHF
jgi:molybdopterin-guanine dinucleotide biosynthesis protein A